MKRWIRTPEFRKGDVVMTGDAIGYQGTFLMAGDLNNFPEELLEFVRNVYLYDYDENGNPIYKVEFLTDEDHLFQENYDRFFNKIYSILEDNGLEVID